MALIPTMFRDWWDDFERPSRLFDQHFGLGLTRDELLNTLTVPSLHGYYRPWRNLLEQSGGVSRIQSDKDKFRVIIDVQQFSPKEITVKTVDNSIVVEAKHEEKKDEHGYISRQFVRRYVLPEGHDIGNVQSHLSSDGVLTITAPTLALSAPGEKIIPIQHTATPAVKNT
ncbi:protein lethal(2)essential for life-like [Copidosoma floridanum]|uniref:protein lethal(2)essential for life-like n=1 Tax=Copidosoma floridanum TaxID=29053 RepID=UPI0006C9AAA0|nr:protein lethal(2)essential for life-like [Copidosoma floridanum]XP_023247625.1 protein lethal(2)essential for life-like [Copidosoma floridanum]